MGPRVIRALCRLIARRMHAANAAYPNPRVAEWVRRQAGMPDPWAMGGHDDRLVADLEQMTLRLDRTTRLLRAANSRHRETDPDAASACLYASYHSFALANTLMGISTTLRKYR